MTATTLSPGQLERPFSEEILALGAAGSLCGILTAPRTRRGDVAGILLNAGVLHRVGPHRLHVRLARELACLGLPVLRLDLAGIGDSAAVAGAASFRESAVANTREVMDGLSASQGVRSFLVMGLCAGADNALATALADERAAGVVLVEPPGYATLASLLRRARSRTAALGLGGALRSLAASTWKRLAASRAPAGNQGRRPPPLAEHRRQLNQLLDRGARVMLVYSGSLDAAYNHPDQLFEYAPELRGRVEVRYYPDANHTFTERFAQAALIEAIAAWAAPALARDS